MHCCLELAGVDHAVAEADVKQRVEQLVDRDHRVRPHSALLADKGEATDIVERSELHLLLPCVQTCVIHMLPHMGVGSAPELGAKRHVHLSKVAAGGRVC
jgi:hypothetical protein